MLKRIFRRKRNRREIEHVVSELHSTDEECLKKLYQKVKGTERSIWRYITNIDGQICTIDMVENEDLSNEKSELAELNELSDKLDTTYNNLIVNRFPKLEAKIRYFGRSGLSDDDRSKIDSDAELKGMLDDLIEQMGNIYLRCIKLEGKIDPIVNYSARALAYGKLERYKMELVGALYDLDSLLAEYKQVDISKLNKTCRTTYSIIGGKLSTTKELIKSTNENVKLILAEVFEELKVPNLHSYLSKQFEEKYA